jgi:hypothetical protein
MSGITVVSSRSDLIAMHGAKSSDGLVLRGDKRSYSGCRHSLQRVPEALGELVAGAPYPCFQRVFRNAEFLGGLPRRVTYHVTQLEGDAQTG